MNETSSGIGPNSPVDSWDDFMSNSGADEDFGLINKFCAHLTMQDAIEDFPITKEDYIYSTIYGILFIIGAIANAVVIVVLVYHRRVLITSAHVYVLHLAIADFLFILNLPIIIQQRLQAHNWNLGRVVCYLHKSAITINFIISIGLLTLLSIDRYIVLVKNAWQNIRIKQRPPRVAHLYALFIWIVGIILSLPYIIVIEYRELTHNNVTEQSCIENWVYYSEPVNITQEIVSSATSDNLDFDYLNSDSQQVIPGEPGVIPDFADGSSSSSSSEFGFPPDFGNDFGEMFGLTPDDPCNFFNILAENITQAERTEMEQAGWTLSKCKEYEKEQIEKCFPQTDDQALPESEFNHSECRNPEELAKKIWLWMIFFTCFVFPAGIMLYCYTRFVLSVSKVNKAVKSFKPTSSIEKQSSDPKRLAFLIIILCSVFFICWTPFQIFHLMRASGITVSQFTCTNMRDVLSLMVYINSCVNPILYSFLGAKFRQRAKKVMITRPLRRLSSITKHTSDFEETTLFTRMSISNKSSTQTSRTSSVRYSTGSNKSGSRTSRSLSKSLSNPVSTMSFGNGTLSSSENFRRMNSTNIDLREIPILEESENSHSNSDNR